MDTAAKNKIYFVSDSHLGVPDYASSLEREKLLVKWLDSIKADAKEIYLLGDIFDYWFEYKQAVPKGYVRFWVSLPNSAIQASPCITLPATTICGCSVISRKN